MNSMPDHNATRGKLFLIAAGLFLIGSLPCAAQVPGSIVSYADVYSSGSAVVGYVSTEYDCWECAYLYHVAFTTDVSATLWRDGSQVASGQDHGTNVTAQAWVQDPAAPPSTSYELRGQHLVSVEWINNPGETSNFGYESDSSLRYMTTLPRAPRVDMISPSSAVQGESGVLTISGADFDSSAVILVDGGGVSMTVMSVSYDRATITAEYTVSPTAVATSYSVRVMTSGGTSGAVFFQVYQAPPPPPHIDGIAPSQNIQCGSGYIEIYGTNFGIVPIVWMGGEGVTISTTYVSNVQVNVRYTLSCTAATGARPFTVTTPSGMSNTVTFTVNPANVQFTAANIEQDFVDVRLSGPASGTLRVDLSGDGMGWLITDGSTYPQGTHHLAIGRDSLPPAEYSTYTATWVIPPGYITDETRIYGYTSANFEIRDVRHTQYNTTYETYCVGAAALAYTTIPIPPPTCTFNATTLKSDFITEANRNGNGVTLQHGSVQREALCMRSPYTPPAGTQDRSFRPVGIIAPACSGQSLGNDTIAVHDDSGVYCGNTIVILAPGGGVEAVKTVKDRCGDDCKADATTHFDNYSTAQCCSWRCSPTIGWRRTIIVR